jgi:hypothetical protein
MKKTLLVAIVCALTATSPLFAQHTQSLSFSNPGPIQSSGQVFNVTVSLTFAGYSSFGLSYWLEVPNALAPFLSITGVTYSTFPDPNQTSPNPAPFSLTSGATAGFMREGRDLGATVNDPTMKMVPPGTYAITNLQFTLAAGAPVGMFSLRNTTVSPTISEVTDTDFNDNNLIPAGSITLNIVPEPSTLALVGVGAVLSGVVAYRRRKSSR